MKLDERQKTGFQYLGSKVQTAARDNDYDALRSALEELSDIFQEIPEQG